MNTIFAAVDEYGHVQQDGSPLPATSQSDHAGNEQLITTTPTMFEVTEDREQHASIMQIKET